MPSHHLMLLESRVHELRRLLLPYRFSPIGFYKDEARVRARALSFRVLAHAEIETYFEERVIEIAKVAMDAWKKQKHVSTVCVHLLAFAGRHMDRPADSKVAPTDNKKKAWSEKLTIDERLQSSITDFIRRTKIENHGVKEPNILSMLLPIGYDCDKIDDIFLTSLNQFGTERGIVAHSSSVGHVTLAVDPKNEHDKVLAIVKDITIIDAELDLLLSSTKP